MTKPLRWYDIITINIFYLGLTTLTQTMVPLVLPLLVQHFVGESQQGTYYGRLRLWALMAALLTQALMGMLSDRSTLRWGRRRPFILVGTLLDLVVIAAIGFSAQMNGLAGYTVLFVLYVLLQGFANTAQSALQSFIPDLVPEEKRGRFSAVKALFEVPVPVVLVSFTIARLVSAGNLWGGLLVLMGVMFITMLPAMLVAEKPLDVAPPPLDWRPFLRLLLMTGLFTATILLMGEGVTLAGRWLSGIESPAVLCGVMGTVGFAAMAVAIVVGVESGFRVSIGTEKSRAIAPFVWWVISRLAFLVSVTNLAGFTLYFLQARLGFTRESAAGPTSRMMMLVGVFILIAALPAGWLADRVGRKKVVAWSGIVAAVGTAITLFATDLTMVFIGACIIGAATGVFYTASWALGTSLVPEGEAGRYLGISNLAGAGAGAVGAYIGGPVADFFTRAMPDIPGLGYVLVFAIYGLLFVLSVVTLAKVKE
ncbi:MAG TPA: MFS transporter [Anaerolineae bacterium]|nr:MFS transporter [Anaerolineae bacterium]HQK14662.1 MFS transporter [Anaerolineae bacterium]